MKDKLKYGIAGMLIGGIAVWVFMSNTPHPSANTGMMGTNSQNLMRNSSALDAHFIEQMIPHHEDAITMAKLAQSKAQHSEIKQLAQNIITSQGKEINQMEA